MSSDIVLLKLVITSEMKKIIDKEMVRQNETNINVVVRRLIADAFKLDKSSRNVDTEKCRALKKDIDKNGWTVDYKQIEEITELANNLETIYVEQTESVILAMVDLGFLKFDESGEKCQFEKPPNLFQEKIFELEADIVAYRHDLEVVEEEVKYFRKGLEIIREKCVECPDTAQFADRLLSKGVVL